MKQSLTVLALAGTLAIFLSLSGCYAWNSANTKAHFSVTPDGALVGDWDSNKQEENLSIEADAADGKFKSLKVHVDKAGSQDAVLAAMARQIDAINNLLNQLVPLAAAAAKAGS